MTGRPDPSDYATWSEDHPPRGGMSVRAHRRIRTVLGAILAAAAGAALAGGFVTVRGWDWTVGTNSHYCGVYLPHWDFYCEHVP